MHPGDVSRNFANARSRIACPFSGTRAATLPTQKFPCGIRKLRLRARSRSARGNLGRNFHAVVNHFQRRTRSMPLLTTDCSTKCDTATMRWPRAVSRKRKRAGRKWQGDTPREQSVGTERCASARATPRSARAAHSHAPNPSMLSPMHAAGSAVPRQDACALPERRGQKCLHRIARCASSESCDRNRVRSMPARKQSMEEQQRLVLAPRDNPVRGRQPAGARSGLARIWPRTMREFFAREQAPEFTVFDVECNARGNAGDQPAAPARPGLPVGTPAFARNVQGKRKNHCCPPALAETACKHIFRSHGGKKIEFGHVLRDRTARCNEAGGLASLAYRPRPFSLPHATRSRISLRLRLVEPQFYNPDTSRNASGSTRQDNWSSEGSRNRPCRGCFASRLRNEERSSGLNSSSQSIESTQSCEAKLAA